MCANVAINKYYTDGLFVKRGPDWGSGSQDWI